MSESTPTPNARVTQAYADLVQQQELEKQQRFEHAVFCTQRRRLLNSLCWACHYTAGEGAERPDFVARWAQCWMHAARTVRQYAGLSTTRGLSLPDSPEYIVAQELFEECLSGESHESISRSLMHHLVGLGEGGKNRALRYFFDFLKEALINLGEAPSSPSVGQLQVESATEGTPPAPALDQRFTFELTRPRDERHQLLTCELAHGPDGLPLRFKISGQTKPHLARALMSQPDQDHTWDDLVRAGNHAGYWLITSPDNLRRIGSEVRRSLPPSLRGYWQQSTTGVRWQSP